jgi:hypothetical protein
LLRSLSVYGIYQKLRGLAAALESKFKTFFGSD